MSVIQTVTYVNTNADVTYANEAEAMDALHTMVTNEGDVLHMETIMQNATIGNMFSTISFESGTQTLTIERTWLNAAWDEYRSAYPLEPNANKSLAESHGWVLTETLETV